MINLDDIDQIKNLDKSNMAGSIEQLGDQIQQTWDEVNKIEIPQDFQNIRNIVFSGMGGSALGAYVAKNLYSAQIKQSFEIINDYHLPGYVNEDTLVVIGSYSGNTEETLSGLEEALRNNAKTIAITTGGKIEEVASQNKIPFYKLKPKYNPSNQPRMGIGYSVFALLTFLSKLDIIKINNKDIIEIKSIISENNNKYGISTSKTTNLAKQFSQKIFNKVPVLIGGEFLIGAIHAIRNQMNENAKSLAIYFPLPELDHHLLEALTFPKNIQEYDHYIFFYSNLYSEKISKRSIITKDVVEQNGHKTSIFKPTGKNKLSQTIESIHFGSYMGYYLSLLYNIDPSPIHWVEEFKKKLG